MRPRRSRLPWTIAGGLYERRNPIPCSVRRGSSIGPALRVLNGKTRKRRVLGLGSLPPGLDLIFFHDKHCEPGGPPTVNIAGGLFRGEADEG